MFPCAERSDSEGPVRYKTRPRRSSESEGTVRKWAGVTTAGEKKHGETSSAPDSTAYTPYDSICFSLGLQRLMNEYWLSDSSATQVSQQQQEAARLNKELLEQRAELALLRGTLQSKEMVRLENILTQTLSVKDVLTGSCTSVLQCCFYLTELITQQTNSL